MNRKKNVSFLIHTVSLSLILPRRAQAIYTFFLMSMSGIAKMEIEPIDNNWIEIWFAQSATQTDVRERHQINLQHSIGNDPRVHSVDNNNNNHNDHGGNPSKKE